MKCKKCDGDVTFEKDRIRGLGFKLKVCCRTCDPVEIESGPRVRNGFEINCRITFAMRQLGQGYSGLTLFCSLMDLFPFVAKTVYNKYCEQIGESVALVAENVMKRAADQEKTETLKRQLFDHSEAVAISVDGS